MFSHMTTPPTSWQNCQHAVQIVGTIVVFVFANAVSNFATGEGFPPGHQDAPAIMV